MSQVAKFTVPSWIHRRAANMLDKSDGLSGQIPPVPVVYDHADSECLVG